LGNWDFTANNESYLKNCGDFNAFNST